VAKEGFTNAKDINGLWKMEIAGCFFTKTFLYVTLHIPLKQIDTDYKTYHVTKFPFQYQDKQCVVEDVTDMIVKVGDMIIPLHGINSKNCRPDERPHCFVPMEEKDSTPFTRCAASLIGSKVVEIQEVC